MLRDAIKRLKSRTVGDVVFRLMELSLDRKRKRRLQTDKYVFDNRSSNSKNLCIILAGFQPFYWDAVFERVRENAKMFDEGIDICVCVPKGETGADELRERCENEGWSYLKIHKDLLAQVQNVAISLHESAEWIFKIDEDILLSKDYFAKLKRAYTSFAQTSYMKVGFVAPLINVNAFGTFRFLNAVGAMGEYEHKFGKYDLMENWHEAAIHHSADVAEFIWERSIPFDQVSGLIAEENRGQIEVCPHRFSIGAILIKREYWEKMSQFEVRTEGSMGVEEAQICNFCMNDMHAIVVAKDVLAGHLGFYSQKKRVREFFESHKKDLMLRT